MVCKPSCPEMITRPSESSFWDDNPMSPGLSSPVPDPGVLDDHMDHNFVAANMPQRPLAEAEVRHDGFIGCSTSNMMNSALEHQVMKDIVCTAMKDIACAAMENVHSNEALTCCTPVPDTEAVQLVNMSLTHDMLTCQNELHFGTVPNRISARVLTMANSNMNDWPMYIMDPELEMLMVNESTLDALLRGVGVDYIPDLLPFEGPINQHITTTTTYTTYSSSSFVDDGSNLDGYLNLNDYLVDSPIIEPYIPSQASPGSPPELDLTNSTNVSPIVRDLPTPSYTPTPHPTDDQNETFSPTQILTGFKCEHPSCVNKRLFPRLCDLNKHTKTHSKNLQCPYSAHGCKSKGFSTEKDKRRHITTVHERRKDFQCRLCATGPNVGGQGEGENGWFSRRDNLKDHERRVHGIGRGDG
ncbi:hypothetical protein DFH27DRAFT_598081 [Peziza echinospora]|nr:hypothetical protein DFH27DRAFT_598081 [Peziza echinospora]